MGPRYPFQHARRDEMEDWLALLPALGLVGGDLRVTQLSHAAHYLSVSRRCSGQ